MPKMEFQFERIAGDGSTEVIDLQTDMEGVIEHGRKEWLGMDLLWINRIIRVAGDVQLQGRIPVQHKLFQQAFQQDIVCPVTALADAFPEDIAQSFSVMIVSQLLINFPAQQD